VIRDVRFTGAIGRDQRSGLLGFVQLRYGDILMDGLAVRLTVDGTLTLSFPSRRDRKGHRFPYYRPADAAARGAFEQEIFEAIRTEVGL